MIATMTPTKPALAPATPTCSFVMPLPGFPEARAFVLEPVEEQAGAAVDPALHRRGRPGVRRGRSRDASSRTTRPSSTTTTAERLGLSTCRGRAGLRDPHGRRADRADDRQPHGARRRQPSHRRRRPGAAGDLRLRHPDPARRLRVPRPRPPVSAAVLCSSPARIAEEGSLQRSPRRQLAQSSSGNLMLRDLDVRPRLSCTPRNGGRGRTAAPATPPATRGELFQHAEGWRVGKG